MWGPWGPTTARARLCAPTCACVRWPAAAAARHTHSAAASVHVLLLAAAGGGIGHKWRLAAVWMTPECGGHSHPAVRQFVLLPSPARPPWPSSSCRRRLRPTRCASWQPRTCALATTPHAPAAAGHHPHAPAAGQQHGQARRARQAPSLARTRARRTRGLHVACWPAVTAMAAVAYHWYNHQTGGKSAALRHPPYHAGTPQVVLFSKTYCPYCTKAKDALKQFIQQFTVIEVCTRAPMALAVALESQSMLLHTPQHHPAPACVPRSWISGPTAMTSKTLWLRSRGGAPCRACSLAGSSSAAVRSLGCRVPQTQPPTRCPPPHKAPAWPPYWPPPVPPACAHAGDDTAAKAKSGELKQLLSAQGL